jgi:two-component system, chemotaxis family, chemotaxis protein CheY
MSIDAQAGAGEPGPKIDVRHPPRLLVVDDDLFQQDLLGRAARLAGFDVLVASSCSQAVRLLHSTSLDCVILDLKLEDGDGIDICREMVAAKYCGALIIVSGTEGTRRSAARAYARSVGIEAQGLPKPVDVSSLRVCLANLGKELQGLPAIHAWGGAAAGQIVEGHRI